MSRALPSCARALMLIALALVSVAAAQSAAPDAAFEARLKKLETELRCLVCQNQTLADSNAELAEDLRREVRQLALSGKSDEEIKSYLVARYGDFVLYQPPLKSTTWLLWVGPFALLLGGGVLWWVILRRRERTVTAPGTSGSDAAAEARGRARLEAYDDEGG